MNKSIGIFAAITAFVVMLSSVMAQPPADGKGKGKGGKGGGPLASKEAFFTKYDTNSDKKVTKDEYMKVSVKDAEDVWGNVAKGKDGKVADSVDEATVEAYIVANPPAFGKGKGKGADGAPPAPPAK